MSEGNETSALISVDDALGVGKFGTKLLDVIARATGVVYEPARIRREARAEHDAALIAAETHIEITEIQKRALRRLVNEEGHKQENIESVLGKALGQVREDSRPEDLDAGWLTSFMDTIKGVSDERAQEIWSKVLAGETNSPGSYSKRTLGILRDLSKREAQVFQELCRFVVTFVEHPVVFSLNDEIYAKSGLTFVDISGLESAGLIRYETLAGFTLQADGDDDDPFLICLYSNTHMCLRYKAVGNDQSEKKIPIGSVMFTSSGQEMRKLTQVEPVDGFVEYLREKWKDRWIEPVAKGDSFASFQIPKEP